MWKNLRTNIIVFVVMVVMVLLLMKTCTPKDTIVNDLKTQESYTLLATKTDTLWARDTIFTLKPFPVHSFSLVPIPYKDTAELDSLRSLCEHMRIYQDSLTDSNLTIYADVRTTGVLDSLNVKYKLKVPITISHDYYYGVQPKISIYAGLEAGYSRVDNKPSIAPVIGLNLTNQSFSYSFGPLNNQHTVRYTKTLYKKYPKPILK